MSERQELPLLQNLEIAKEWTLDCDLFCDESLARKVFTDPEEAKQHYAAMFLQIRNDLCCTDSQQTKIYVERIDVRIQNNVLIYEVRYPNAREHEYSIGQINPQFENTGTETITILRQISDVKEGGGKWNASSDLEAFWYGFL